jgi:RNA polymerase sigma factor (sigma-70 family)
MSANVVAERVPGNDPRAIETVELVSLCAQDTGNSALWCELLRRITPKIKAFIRGTLRQHRSGSFDFPDAPLLSGGFQESDLFQNTIVRLVQNDCAVMRRFSGITEEEFMAYLAVITRSVVSDFLRRQRALKRPISHAQISLASLSESRTDVPDSSAKHESMERELLAREVADLSMRMIRDSSGETSARDQLIFQLYFTYGLSTTQIAQCKGVELSKPGVEKVLNRLKDRVRNVAGMGHSEATIQ